MVEICPDAVQSTYDMYLSKHFDILYKLKADYCRKKDKIERRDINCRSKILKATIYGLCEHLVPENGSYAAHKRFEFYSLD